MPAYNLIADSGFSQAYHVVLLPNGKILLTGGITAGAAIIDPDENGEYADPDNIRSITPPTLRHTYNAVTRDLAGDYIFFWGSEYANDFSHTEPDYVTVFDVDAETFSSSSASFSDSPPGHRPVIQADDGTHVGMNGKHMAPDDDPLSGDVYTEAYSNQPFHQETGYCLWPDGRLVAFRAMYVVPGGGIAPRGVDEVWPKYPQGFIDDGSFYNGGTFWRTHFRNCDAELDTYPATWHGDTVGWRTNGQSLQYEVGPNIYLPSINKVVIMGGTGVVWGYKASDSNGFGNEIPGTWTLQRMAEVPIDGRVATQIGVIPAGEAGRSISDIADGDALLDIDCTGFSSEMDEFLIGFENFPKTVIHIITDGGTKVSSLGLDATPSPAIARSGDTTSFTDLGHADQELGGGGTSILAEGDPVYANRPQGFGADGGCFILPNGEIVFNVQTNEGKVYFYAIGGYLVKWDGIASETELWSDPDDLADYQTNWRTAGTYLNGFLIPPSPSQRVLSVNVDQLGYFELTEAEKTSPSGYKPIIDSFPANIETGETYTLVGRQLNGIHQGGTFGDDRSPDANNIPIVRFQRIGDGKVFYGHTRNRTYCGIQPNRSSQIDVEIPSTEGGVYYVDVVVSGVASERRLIGVDTVITSYQGSPGIKTTGIL